MLRFTQETAGDISKFYYFVEPQITCIVYYGDASKCSTVHSAAIICIVYIIFIYPAVSRKSGILRATRKKFTVIKSGYTI